MLSGPSLPICIRPAEAKDVTVKRTEVLNYDPSLYRTTRLEATAADGTKVSVSLVWRADRREAALAAKRPMPLLLDGYGSYGICCEPDFSYFRLPLLDRGCAPRARPVVAHPRTSW